MIYRSNLAPLARASEVSNRDTPERVYVAAPKSEYDSPRYGRLVEHLQTLFPNTELIEARTAFKDVNDWRVKWPSVLASISGVIFLTTPQGMIGRGVWTEIRQAMDRGLPVFLITEDQSLLPSAALRFSLPNLNNWTAHVRVTVGSAE